jgi:hypothetical protein
MADPAPKRRFQLVLIKPSHYDDDGYPIQWLKSDIPANTLAALNGLALDCRDTGAGCRNALVDLR